MSEPTSIKQILLYPGIGKEVYLKHSNETLLLHPYRNIRNMTMHNTLNLISKIPHYLEENNLTISKTVVTNFDIIMIVGYNPYVLKKALNRVINCELEYK